MFQEKFCTVLNYKYANIKKFCLMEITNDKEFSKNAVRNAKNSQNYSEMHNARNKSYPDVEMC